MALVPRANLVLRRVPEGMSSDVALFAGDVMGTGFHATNPQAAVYWNPANTATGAYTLKGTFTLMKPSGHTNYYGLVFGGSGLDGASQNYTYFLVAQDGTWLVKKREGEMASDVIKKTPSGAFIIKISASAAIGPPNPGDDGGFILTLGGGDRYCVAFGGPAGGVEQSDTATVWQVIDATGEACPVGYKETTTTTTTTSTTTST